MGRLLGRKILLDKPSGPLSAFFGRVANLVSFSEVRAIPTHQEEEPEAYLRWGQPSDFDDQRLGLKPWGYRIEDGGGRANIFDEVSREEDMASFVDNKGQFEVSVPRIRVLTCTRRGDKPVVFENEIGGVFTVRQKYTWSMQNPESYSLDMWSAVKEVTFGGVWLVITALFRSRTNVLTNLELLEPAIGIRTDSDTTMEQDFMELLTDGSVERDNEGGKVGSEVEHREAEPVNTDPSYVVTQVVDPSDISGMEHKIYEAGGMLIVDGPDSMSTGEAESLADAEVDPDAWPPQEYHLDGTIGGIVYLAQNQIISGDAVLPDPIERATDGGVTHYSRFFNNSDGDLIEYVRKVFVFRPFRGEHDYRYYPSFYYCAWGVNISKLWAFGPVNVGGTGYATLSQYYTINGKPIAIAFEAASPDEPEEDLDDSGRIRWALYSGPGMDPDEDSAIGILREGIMGEVDGGGGGGGDLG